MNSPQSFSDWWHRWNRWSVLAAAILEFFVFLSTIKEYQTVASLHIFSDAQYEKYALAQKSYCLLSGTSAAALMGIFLIGTFARSKKSARFSESILLLAMSFAIGLWMILFFARLSRFFILVFTLILILTVFGWIHTFCQYRNEAKQNTLH